MNLAPPTEALTGEGAEGQPPKEKPLPEPPPSPAEIARHFPQLEILECLGRGGMGVVYRARQPQLNRLVALKILAPEKEQDASFAERFTREAQALGRLSHQSIVAIHDFGKVDGLYYLLMEYVDGVSLRQLLQTKTLTPAEALAAIRKICDALQYAHEQGVVHRDIKPENVLLNKEGQVKIADFGIAKIVGGDPRQQTVTRDQQVIGTPHYMAPEQVEHPHRVDHRADIYSLGVVFYEMLTGELPIGKFAPPSRKVQVDVRLDEVVLKTLEKEPERRYQQASEVKSDVETIAIQSPLGAPPAPSGRAQKRLAFAVLAGLAVALVVTLVRPLLRNVKVGSAEHPQLADVQREQENAERPAVDVVLTRTALQEKGAERQRTTDEVTQLAEEGWRLWHAGRVQEARVKFIRAVKLAPETEDLWNGLGWSAYLAGDQREAETAFQKVLALHPNHGAALNGLGRIYFDQRKYDLAESNLLEAARTAPAARVNLAALYLIKGKFEQAERCASNAVVSGENDEFVRQMLKAAREKYVSQALRLQIEPR